MDAPTATLHPLVPLAPTIGAQPVTRANLVACLEGPAYQPLLDVFGPYPPHSFMSDQSRIILYTLIRMMRPDAVAEIGTLHTGTTEVMARALHENGAGVVHTTDPFGAERCPRAIATWPSELQRHVRFYPLNSMDFFLALGNQRIAPALVLVDGNHDFEFALFDLQMAARLIRPGGIVIMDNSEQSGPFKASRVFLEANPAWRELGSALSSYDPFRPFDRERASLPYTAFIILQAPAHLSIGEGPHSQGQVSIETPRVAGLTLDIIEPTRGTLFYQVFLRGFADGNRWARELQTDGSLRIDGIGRTELRFDRPLVIDAPAPGAVFTLEVDLSWQGNPSLALAATPTPIG
jgi:predicted O-methyltransferase YrrM